MRTLLLLALLAVLALGLACNGGGGGGATPTEEAPEATSTSEDVSTPEDGETDGAAHPFESFHYVVDLTFSISDPEEGETPAITGRVEGDFVTPDSHAFSSSFELAGISGSEAVVIIGDDAWFRSSGGDWRATSASDPEVRGATDLTSADPEFLSGEQLAQDLAGLDSERETVNGVETRRYRIPREAVETLTQIFGDDFLAETEGLREFDMTVWLHEETDAVVRAEIEATAGPELFGDEPPPFDISPDASIIVSMRIDITRINDDSITVEPPI